MLSRRPGRPPGGAPVLGPGDRKILNRKPPLRDTAAPTHSQARVGAPAAYALLLVTPVLFACNNVAARWAAGTVPPIAMAFWRWALTFLMILPVVAGPLWSHRDLVRREFGRLFVLGGIGMAASGALVYVGAKWTPATNIGLIYGSAPALILLLDWLVVREPLAMRQIAGVLMCMAGVVLIVAQGDPAVLAGLKFTIGDLWIVLGAASWSIYSVLLRHLPSRLPLLPRFAGMTLAGTLALLPVYWLEIASGRTMRLDAHDIGTVAFLALVTGLGAFLAHARLTALLGTRRTGLLLYIIPIYNAVLAMVVLGEELHLYHLAGTLMILPGVYFATRAR